MSKPIKAPVHEYSKHTVNIGEEREFGIEKGSETSTTTAKYTEYGIKFGKEWGASLKFPLSGGASMSTEQKTSLELSITKSFGYEEKQTYSIKNSDSVKIKNDSGRVVDYIYQERADFSAYVVQVFKIDYQINKWKSSSPFDFTTYYGYDNLGRMRLVDEYTTWVMDLSKSTGLSMDGYYTNEHGKLTLLNDKQDSNVIYV
jgi:hypothetical protein